ncbi:acetyltransferase [Caulobacter ginsengisoli]|uniref:Acetyltransferase n=1 Tax=Caulobacter ginsengisoli TaxID=400775 RepID=A0ABU0IVC0_9CAUL|nr:bifunctional acetate--CoA ligase family protein/GNAT family N-acetyltransferase [Caulobacter ginsengisoli]MDQ0465968.1 acetyltransferase [Caulobacter ginsengisoli]
MTTRNLDALFEPRSIALIGASNHEGSVGAVLARNLLETGFQGPVMAVNPHAASIRSTLAYPSIADLPIAPDLAVIAIPAAGVPDLIAELGARGCRAAVVISAGFDAGEHGLRQKLLDAARPHLLRIVGPNCLGFISPGRGVNASFAQLTPAAGGLALVSQSGAITTAALDWAAPRGFGFSHVVSLGDQADVDFGDMLDYLALDPRTHAILLYVESIHDARKFMTAGRIAARSKPVVVIKAGRGAAGARAAFSHTGALAGSDAVYDAAFRRAGMLRVTGLRELFDAVATLTAGLRIEGERLAILTNGGGAGVMAADALEAAGGRLATISEAGRKRLAAVLPPTAGLGNPIDIIGDAQPDRYRAALEVLLEEPEADAVLVMNCPTAVADSTAAARAVVETVAGRSRPVLSCWLGDPSAAEGRRVLAAAGIPAHETPEEAVLAFQHLAAHRASQRQLLRAPSAGAPQADKAAARALVEAAMATGRDRLTDPEARALLAAYAIPVIESREAPTPKAAGAVAEALGGPVALKILSPDISHKSDIGGVMLGLTGAAAVEAAAAHMLESIGAQKPEARLEGFIVEAMAVRPRAEELIVGLTQDAVFGPVVLFGRGGIAVELEADRAVGLAPLDEVLADDLIGRTRVAKRLAGYRDRPPADRAALGRVLTALSQLAIDLPEVAELDINPLLADADGVLALDARVRLAKPGPASRPAIGPYPEGLDRQMVVQGIAMTVRPIRPQDAPRLTEMVAKSSAEDVRLRFRAGLHGLPDSWAERLAHIDYDREMALVAELPDGAIAGVARLAADPEALRAEFALMVRSDWSGRGLGSQLLGALLDYAAGRGLKEMWGDTDRDNARMLGLAEAAGFKRAAGDDPSRIRMTRAFP